MGSESTLFTAWGKGMCGERPESKKERLSNESARRLWLSYVPDSVLTAIVLTLTIGGSYLVWRTEYVGGLHGTGVGRGFLPALGLKPLTVFITLVVIAPMAVIRLLIRRHTLGHLLLRLAFPAVCLVALLIPIETETGAPVYLQGFGQRMLAKVDIEAIQQWLATDGVKYVGREYRHNFPSDLPGCLTEFHPWLITFSDITSEHGVLIEFRWYAPHGENFGLVIGPPSMESSTDDITWLPDSSMSEFRRPIKPGAYVFARG